MRKASSEKDAGSKSLESLTDEIYSFKMLPALGYSQEHMQGDMQSQHIIKT
jgi:hypothetical protein